MPDPCFGLKEPCRGPLQHEYFMYVANQAECILQSSMNAIQYASVRPVKTSLHACT